MSIFIMMLFNLQYIVHIICLKVQTWISVFLFEAYEVICYRTYRLVYQLRHRNRGTATPRESGNPGPIEMLSGMFH